MTSGILQDSLPVTGSGAPPASSPRFRPYASPNHHVIKSRYITSNDPRGYIPVYEYPLNGQWIMMDVDDGYILWTGIWKALGNSKADIVKMIESQPDLASQIRRVRGGYLKIQGTWMPYEVALRLSRRVAWPIRHDLVPLFGPTFPTTCLSPEQPGYGQVIANGSGRRRTRRSNHVQNAGMVPTGSSGPQAGWTIISGPSYPHEIRQSSPPQFSHQLTSPFANPSAWPTQHQKIESTPSPTDTLSIDGGVDRLSLTRERSHNARYSPYPGTSGPNNAPFPPNVSSPVGPSRSSFSDASGFTGPRRMSVQEERIKLPPLQPPTTARASGQAPISLPPISSWAAPSQFNDSRAVLQRLRASDAADLSKPFPPSPEEQLNHRRRSSSAPSNTQSFDFEPPRSLGTSMGGETHHWTPERSRSQDSPRLKTLAHRRPSDSSSAVTSPSTSFLLSTPDGVSPSDPSPVLPLTPHSSAPLPRELHDSHPSSMKELSGNNRAAVCPHTYADPPRPGFGYDRDQPQSYGRRGGAEAFPLPQLKTEASPTFHEPAKLWDRYSANHTSSQPVRPW
ncbi:hypothetical protein H4582DRAFT_792016 [Lactarius indigo]|nr:hypothetical protein H4582DRAFT_792016 [Lactarius indigo]